MACHLRSFERILGGISYCTRWADRFFPATGLKLFGRGTDRVKIVGTFLPSGFTARDAMARSASNLFRRWVLCIKNQKPRLDCQLLWLESGTTIDNNYQKKFSWSNFFPQSVITHIIQFRTPCERTRTIASRRKMFSAAFFHRDVWNVTGNFPR